MGPLLRLRKPRMTVSADRLERPLAISDRRTRHLAGAAWGLLFFDVLAYSPALSLVPLPTTVGKVFTQAALPLALLMALSANRGLAVRPNVFLGIIGLLAVDATLTSLQPQFFGTVYRTVRLVGFIAVLWLMTPWWGRGDLLLLRAHMTTLAVALGSVLLGLALAPQRALGLDGRLNGVIWSIPCTQVAHYAAVFVGLTALLWLDRRLGGGVAGFAVAVAAACLLLTHTRTAIGALVAGLLVAGLSMITQSVRARWAFAVVTAAVAISAITMSHALLAWLARGQGTQELLGLTGRTLVWHNLLVSPRNHFQLFFGFGVSNANFNGSAIDSTWLAAYQQYGLFGVAVCAAALIFLILAACFRLSGVRRALVLFLTIYCLVASVTEVGFTGPSPYLLDIAVAASLLMPRNLPLLLRQVPRRSRLGRTVPAQ